MFLVQIRYLKEVSLHKKVYSKIQHPRECLATIQILAAICSAIITQPNKHLKEIRECSATMQILVVVCSEIIAQLNKLLREDCLRDSHNFPILKHRILAAYLAAYLRDLRVYNRLVCLDKTQEMRIAIHSSNSIKWLALQLPMKILIMANKISSLYLALDSKK